jgi:hypothetical protein
MKTESAGQKREKEIKKILPAYLERDKTDEMRKRSDVSRKLRIANEYYNRMAN